MPFSKIQATWSTSVSNLDHLIFFVLYQSSSFSTGTTLLTTTVNLISISSYQGNEIITGKISQLIFKKIFFINPLRVSLGVSRLIYRWRSYDNQPTHHLFRVKKIKTKKEETKSPWKMSLSSGFFFFFFFFWGGGGEVFLFLKNF